jgi:PAS domain-containing protein
MGSIKVTTPVKIVGWAVFCCYFLLTLYLEPSTTHRNTRQTIMKKALTHAPVGLEPEVALHESEAMFSALAEMASSAVFIFQGTRTKFVNPAAERLTGY